MVNMFCISDTTTDGESTTRNNSGPYYHQERLVCSICASGLFQKNTCEEGGGGRGWEDGRQFIFVWVVGAEIFQIIWVIGVQPNLITWVVGVGYYRPKKERSFYLI